MNANINDPPTSPEAPLKTTPSPAPRWRGWASPVERYSL